MVWIVFASFVRLKVHDLQLFCVFIAMSLLIIAVEMLHCDSSHFKFESSFPVSIADHEVVFACLILMRCWQISDLERIDAE